MALKLDVDRREFLEACHFAVSVDGLMERFKISRDQVKYLRKRLRESGYEIKPLKPLFRESHAPDKGMKDTTPLGLAREKFKLRLKYCDKRGYMLDGKMVKIQKLFEMLNS